MCRLRNIAMRDYQESVTTRQIDRRTDKRRTVRRRTKWSLCATMLSGACDTKNSKPLLLKKDKVNQMQCPCFFKILFAWDVVKLEVQKFKVSWWCCGCTKQPTGKWHGVLATLIDSIFVHQWPRHFLVVYDLGWYTIEPCTCDCISRNDKYCQNWSAVNTVSSSIQVHALEKQRTSELFMQRLHSQIMTDRDRQKDRNETKNFLVCCSIPILKQNR